MGIFDGIKDAIFARDAALIEAGFDVAFSPNGTLGLTYQGQIASDAQEHGFNAKLDVQF